jgi:hypothetical protein
MTNAELKQAFNLYYDSIANFASPGYEDLEISVFLNKATDTIVEQLYNAGRINDIAELVSVEKYEMVPCTLEELGDYAYEAEVDDNFWFYVNSRTLIKSRTEIITWTNEPFWIDNQLSEKDKMRFYVTNKMNVPILLHPKVAIHGSWITVPSNHFHTKMIVITDKYCVVDYERDVTFELTYVRYPDRIDVSGETVKCQLAESLHDKVAALAANIAIQITEKERMAKQPQQRQQQQQQ